MPAAVQVVVLGTAGTVYPRAALVLLLLLQYVLASTTAATLPVLARVSVAALTSAVTDGTSRSERSSSSSPSSWTFCDQGEGDQ